MDNAATPELKSAIDKAETYLKNLISGVADLQFQSIGSFDPFGELGIDSFFVLKIVKELESDFGTLPKTLLFENFHVNDLANYFVDNHPARMAELLGMETGGDDSADVSRDVPSSDSEESVNHVRQAEQEQGPVLMLEQYAYSDKVYSKILKSIYKEHKNESSVSRGTRTIAPNIFLDSRQQGFFNYARSGKIILGYAYTGPADQFDRIAAELDQHCSDRSLQFSFFTHQQTRTIAAHPYTSTPFGVTQRIRNLPEFTLKGSRMRRLRYLVSKFEKNGSCRTCEYLPGSDPEIDNNIATIVDAWCSDRTKVNPLIHTVKDEILHGTLDTRHRVFLTWLGDVLQNVILVSPISDGYLMDLEFYGKDMPLGGLEYSICEIVDTLVSEGSQVLSLGGTYGCKLDDSDNADPAIEKVLEDLRSQNIFNDEGNLQFKNKFRTENTPIYLCRRENSNDAGNVLDIIMMIADPEKLQSSDSENHTHTESDTSPSTVEIGALEVATPIKKDNRSVEMSINPQPLSGDGIRQKEENLRTVAFNVQSLADSDVEIDLKTDSWAQLDTSAIRQRMDFLRSKIQTSTGEPAWISDLFPFKRQILTESGRAAEKLYWSSQSRNGVVPQNILFPTGIYNQIDNGFEPLELPHPSVAWSPHADAENRMVEYQGGICISSLEKALSRGKVSHVCVELLNNATGGQPLTLDNLQAVRKLLSDIDVPLVLDITRVLENSVMLLERDEREVTPSAVWQLSQKIMALADVIVGSLAKDFCVDTGGIVCVRDEAQYKRLQDSLSRDGGALNPVNGKLVALSLGNRDYLTRQVQNRITQTRKLWHALHELNVPLVSPAGGHCVVIDAKVMEPFNKMPNPAASFCAWLYMTTGIRAGEHSVGLQKEGVLNQCVRLALAVGTDSDTTKKIIEKLSAALGHIQHVPILELDSSDLSQQLGSDKCFSLRQVYNPIRNTGSATEEPDSIQSDSITPASDDSPVAATVDTSIELQETELPSGHTAVDIAVIGMAGRYPKSANMQEFWENLRNGRDCISEISDERLRLRRQHPSTPGYRAGFIDDIDRFDSLFFNISPREAETLDPQERHFLEVAWECLEDAGYYPESLTQSGTCRDVGVYVGTVWSTYQTVGAEERLLGNSVVTNSFQWSIANRVSYCLNLTGPSMAVDTACSASLTALYLACEGIRKGDCDSAIVGGVNLDVHPGKQDVTVAGGLLSTDGLCKTFGAGGDGYVPGEGVGALLLKPLAKAIEDNDQVYGVIKSAAINHGGRTSGYSVPNPKAQAALIQSALSSANIDPRTIGYVEAHGTGTELGDPIEIAGLKSAFADQQMTDGGCAIGSVKTNIGHLEAAAGIVGISKVLLQMKYRTLVPSLHSAELNSHIDFEQTPFTVQQESTDWPGVTLDGQQYPLRAGVSSFGAGGSNAHIILESYEPEQKKITEELPGSQVHYFPLSARTAAELKASAGRFHTFLESAASGHQALSDLSAQSVSKVLRTGRKCFAHRVVFLAKSLEACSEQIASYLSGGTEAITGQVSEAESVTALLSASEKNEFIQLVACSGDQVRTAQLWASGVLDSFPPESYDKRVHGISLPTYPFADRRHWILPSDNTLLSVSPVEREIAHPMIDANESTFQKQLFRKTFTIDEFYIYDHLVSGIPTLPGVAYLDYARKAGEIAADMPVKSIRNIVWISPIVVENSTPAVTRIELTPIEDAVQFEVFSEDENAVRKPHSQGKLTFGQIAETAEVLPPLDISAIVQPSNRIATGAEAYPVFSSLGLELGKSFQALQAVYQQGSVVVGVLELPDVVSDTLENFMLHPSLVDSAFQAAMAAQVMGTDAEMFVPYSLGEVEIFHPLTRRCFSYVEQTAPEGSKVSKADVHIIDESGKVLVRITDSVGVPLTSVHEKDSPQDADVNASSTDEFRELFYELKWNPVPLPEEAPDQGVGNVLFFCDQGEIAERYRQAYCNAEAGDAIIVRSGPEFIQHQVNEYTLDPRSAKHFENLAECLAAAQLPVQKYVHCRNLETSGDQSITLDQKFEGGIYELIEFLRWQINSAPKTKVQILFAYHATQGLDYALLQAYNGLFTILQAESPKLVASTLDIDAAINSEDELAHLIQRELQCPGKKAAAIRYVDGARQVRSIVNHSAGDPLIQDQDANLCLKEHGVYLITGGAGGLGLMFAEYIVNNCTASVVLSGRSRLTAEKSTLLKKLSHGGSEVVYIETDMASRQGVENLLAQTREKFGHIDGVIHSAGVVRDSYIKTKTVEEMDAVFGAKIKGTVYLDELSKGDNLDWFVTFSSLAALAGNAGQSDYSYANHFMDSYSAERNKWVEAGLRSGLSLSINWSIWADGGMQLDEQTELFFRNNLGISPLQKEFGFKAFFAGLAAGNSQLAVIEGVQHKIEKAWGVNEQWEMDLPQLTSDTQPGSASAGALDSVADLVIEKLSSIVMDFLKLDEEDLDLDAILLDLGFDSIGLTTFANTVNQVYELDITPVLFFEYPSIKEIAGHFAEAYPENVGRAHGAENPAAAPESVSVDTGGTDAAQSRVPGSAATALPFASDKTQKWLQTGNESTGESGTSPNTNSSANRFQAEPMAIVGMSGVMPQADDVAEYWEKLFNAENNMITVIPEDRWNWEEYQGDPIKEKNKTNSKWGGFMRDVDKFDPFFFGISPREAEMMDPQQRIFLETVWKTVEDAGHSVAELVGSRTGLFVGAATNDYTDLMNTLGVSLDGYSASGNSHAVLANRVSFLLGLRGPSAPIDTACSSSLIAVHRAIESIHSGSCDMAIVGGIQVMLTPAAYISFGMAGMLSDDGKCKTFDKDADGYVRGEGSGAILIKPLSKAIEDRNHVYAVIKSTAENHGGRVTALTAPNPSAQAELLVDAYEKAEVDPRTVGYIECHGTGTSLGDPIEIQGMKKAFAELYKKAGIESVTHQHCGLSSVKTNIGHLETAAGIAGILKVLLAIKHRKIPASLHFNEINPYINLDDSPFYIVDKSSEWNPAEDSDGNALPRIAGISSFGFGGSNAHIVLEEYANASQVVSDTTEQPVVFILSAKNHDRLVEYSARMVTFLKRERCDLAGLAFTSQIGRDEMEARLAVVVDSIQSLVEKLQQFRDGEPDVPSLYTDGAGSNGKKRSAESKAAASTTAARVEKLVESGDMAELAREWVGGSDIPWLMLYPTEKPYRVSMPTYPFARERYWFNTEVTSARAADMNGGDLIHPLVQQNTSTLNRQSYRSTFSGNERILAEYQVDGQSVFPGMAYLEMLRIAFFEAADLSAEQHTFVLRDLNWFDLSGVGNNLNIEIVLGEVESEGLDMRIYAEESGLRKLMCSCQAFLGEDGDNLDEISLPEAVLEQLSQAQPAGDSEFYAQAAEKSITYGPSYRCIRGVHGIDNTTVACLDTTACKVASDEGYQLNPFLLESVVQIANSLGDGSGPDEAHSLLPASVEVTQVLNSTTEQMFLRIDRSEVVTANGTMQLTAALFDDAGALCAILRNLVFTNNPGQSDPRTFEDVNSILDGLTAAGEREAPHGMQQSADAAAPNPLDELESLLEKIY